MTVLFVILPLALLFSSLSVWAFVWTARSGQLDDLKTPSLRALEPDEGPAERAAIERR
ncbi:MAG TPA: cbb3-type cytochrome oxidase assembly protein CcoS [Polyangiaceae bacterium]|nr:cbb3-type cytochrome oxidase assembly protein CcoS [Polyangiaceae bacterium]